MSLQVIICIRCWLVAGWASSSVRAWCLTVFRKTRLLDGRKHVTRTRDVWRQSGARGQAVTSQRWYWLGACSAPLFIFGTSSSYLTGACMVSRRSALVSCSCYCVLHAQQTIQLTLNRHTVWRGAWRPASSPPSPSPSSIIRLLWA